jgi:uncharacterized protein (DUF58 family)
VVAWFGRLRGRLGGIGRVHRLDCAASLHLRAPLLPLAFLAFLVRWALHPTAYAFTGAVFSGSLLLISLIWIRSMALLVSTRRALRFTALQVGDHLEEVLFLENRSLLPVVFAEFIDHSAMPGYAIHGVRVAGPCSTEQWRLHANCTQRGVYSLGHWEVRLADPLGVFEARQLYRQPDVITVFPPVATLPLPVTSHHRTLGDRLALRQAVPADTVNAMSTRPYVAGDPARRIHWRTSARQRELFVKLFEPEANSVIWLILDLDQAVHIGQGNESSLEKMIIVGASLASRRLDEQLAVGMLLNAERTQVVPPRSGRDYRWTVLHALAAAEPSSRPLATTLARAASIVSVRDSVAIVTPSLDPSWLEALPALTAGARGGLEVWLLDPASFGGAGHAVSLASQLHERGIPTQILQRGDIHPVLGAYDSIRTWEFRTLATGRALLNQSPRPSRAPYTAN